MKMAQVKLNKGNKWRWRLLGIVIFFACIVVCFFSAESLKHSFAIRSQPTYAGHSLAYWTEKLLQYDDPLRRLPTNAPSVIAIKSIGPEAVPFLIGWLKTPLPTTSQDQQPNLYRRAIAFAQTNLLHTGQEELPPRRSVVVAFRVLGEAADDAIPGLSNLLSSASVGMSRRGTKMVAASREENN